MLISGDAMSTLLTTPHFAPRAAAPWFAWIAATQPTDRQLWARRIEMLGSQSDYECWPLGQFAELAPETLAPRSLPAGATLLVATDGAELDLLDRRDITSWFNWLLTRKPTDPRHPYPHGDIAIISVRAS
jgi:hypothetical protein